MKTFKATTKAGKSYDVRFLFKPDERHEERFMSSSVNVEININGKWYSSTTLVTSSGVYYVMLFYGAQKALGIDSSKTIYIECENWKPLFHSCLDEQIATWKKQANEISFDKIKFTWSTSYRYSKIYCNADIAADLMIYNDQLIEMHKLICLLNIDIFDEYCVKEDRGEYNITSFYEMTVDQYNELIAKHSTEIIAAQKQNEEKANEIPNAIRKAVETKEKVFIDSYSLPEDMTPLKDDGEDDIVTCSVYAYPDGSVKEEYTHNY